MRKFCLLVFIFQLVSHCEAQRAVFMNRADETVAGFDFANDVFFKTDKYFTHGTRIFTYNDFLKSTPLRWLNLKTSGPKTDYYQGIYLLSNLYTPRDLEDTGIIINDRPYASYMLIGLSGISNNPSDKYRLTSEVAGGVMGNTALGKQIQSLGHLIPPNNPPKGWDKQLSNSFVANYFTRIDYLLAEVPRRFEGFVSAEGNIGTLQINGSVGGFVRLGLFDPYLRSIGPTTRRNVNYKRITGYQIYIRVGQELKLVGFDGTMEGGLIKQKQNQYTLASQDVTRQLWNTHAALGFSLRNLFVEVRGDYVTHQFKGGTDHRWGNIHVGFAF
ncbi:MAG: lipid A-modifier LpxR family protein [Bacteroidia bacterium]